MERKEEFFKGLKLVDVSNTCLTISEKVYANEETIQALTSPRDGSREVYARDLVVIKAGRVFYVSGFKFGWAANTDTYSEWDRWVEDIIEEGGELAVIIQKLK